MWWPNKILIIAAKNREKWTGTSFNQKNETEENNSLKKGK